MKNQVRCFFGDYATHIPMESLLHHLVNQRRAAHAAANLLCALTPQSKSSTWK